MVLKGNACSPEQLAILSWTARLGAVTAEALARREACTTASARARLLALVRTGLVSRRQLLAGAPSLYTLTRAGLRASGLRGLEPARVSVAGARHAIACAAAAAALERAYPDHTLMGERELRREERAAGAPLASACLREGPGGGQLLHRPDLVLWQGGAAQQLPVAIEVELTVKAPRRLLEICRAWARCRCVAGTLYFAAPDVQRPLARALAHADAGERVGLLGLDALEEDRPGHGGSEDDGRVQGGPEDDDPCGRGSGAQADRTGAWTERTIPGTA